MCYFGVYSLKFWRVPQVRMKRSRTLCSLPPHVLSLLLSVEKLKQENKFNQRSEKMQRQRKTVKGDQIIIV